MNRELSPKMSAPDEANINRISHVVSDWDEFEQWCVSRDCDHWEGYDIMCRAKSAEDADKIWEG